MGGFTWTYLGDDLKSMRMQIGPWRGHMTTLSGISLASLRGKRRWNTTQVVTFCFKIMTRSRKARSHCRWRWWYYFMARMLVKFALLILQLSYCFAHKWRASPTIHNPPQQLTTKFKAKGQRLTHNFRNCQCIKVAIMFQLNGFPKFVSPLLMMIKQKQS